MTAHDPYPVDSHIEQQQKYSNLTRRWQRKFAFFDAYGYQGATPAARAAFKQLSFGQRMALNSNILAFLFGPIYFFCKGMWRKGLGLLIASLLVGAVLFAIDAPAMATRLIGFFFAGMSMVSANWAYYLHVSRHSASWNMLEGTRKQKPQK